MKLFLIALLVVLALGWLIARTRRQTNRSGDGGSSDGSFNSNDYNSSSDGGSCGDGGGGGD